MPTDVSFDVTLKGANPGAPAGLATIDQLRPSQEAIERCVRFLASKGVAVHATACGVACSAPAEVFESRFGVTLSHADDGPGAPSYKADGEPTAPAEIFDIVEAVTLAGAPEFF